MAEKPHVVVLAAGRATRFGGGKLDAPCAGKRLGQWVLDAVAEAGLAPGAIVVGPDVPAFARAAPGWRLLVNPQPEAGLGTSLALAARDALSRRDDAPMLVLLADMPLVPPGLIAGLAGANAPAAIRHETGRPGVPALFPASLLPQLAQLGGDRGAASLLAGLDELTLLDPPESALLDIDRPADLARAEAELSR
ncbi:CTP:molybdopterin cytidylyltransferase MocA [Altererythrobacter atlanticus]|uniref:Molybdopterin-guanine dinucleotide biosynthesis protein MobA n=1 Tax=Croceibacterium atlanticum TaxID=1267766 RepID=A0A0F7KYB4_9SPHN|nr:nucleotidyltransferase family protein [Croceibacterium atlanticum]AKH44212.1 molybdopterin-guanine dinucleotide biosynthesis protein MobA [Croceibacterium atlanticum]MBB5732523.1 CTP:molybdopterin cytidylyltransferase MocA [Croceibacterium atlanticum]